MTEAWKHEDNENHGTLLNMGQGDINMGVCVCVCVSLARFGVLGKETVSCPDQKDACQGEVIIEVLELYG